MSGFERRMTPAQDWELDLAGKLTDYGWLVAPFGQGQLPYAMRDRLKDWLSDDGHPTPLRWLPDMIASFERPGNTPYVCLIDAKTETERRRFSENYSVEVAAVDAGLVLMDMWRLPLFYVWRDAKMLTPAAVRKHGEWRDGKTSNGSKTDYYLVKKGHAQPAPNFFHKPDGPSSE